MEKREKRFMILIFVAPCLLKLAERWRVGSGWGKSYFLVGEITTHVKTEILWYINIVYCDY